MSDEATLEAKVIAARGGRWFVIALLCIVSALCAAAAYPPIDLWPVVILWPALLTIAALRARSTLLVVIWAFATHFFLWLWMQRWLIDVSAVGLPFLAAYLAAYAAVYVWIMRRIMRSASCRVIAGGSSEVMARSEHDDPRTARRSAVPWHGSAAIPATFTLPIIWSGLEFFRGGVWMDGYPWFLIGHPLINEPVLAQSADLFGSYFTSFLAGIVAGLVVDIWRGLRNELRRPRLALIGATACPILIANLAYGFWRTSQEPRGERIQILAIQTNLKQDNKRAWSYEEQLRDVPHFAQLTADAVQSVRDAGADIDLIVWPETMVPGFGFEPQTIAFLVENSFAPTDRWLQLMQAMEETFAAPLLVGSACRLNVGVEPDPDGSLRYTWDRSHNSAYLIAGEPPYQRYDKIFLTPFGETMPYISNWPWLEEKLLGIGAEGMVFDLDEGDEPVRLTLATDTGQVTIATPICFEATMPTICRRLVWSGGEKAAPILINLSNDGWFGDYDGGRLQHAQIARFRCIENRVPMVRAVNTGLSMHIDSLGSIIEAVGGGRQGLMREEGFVLADVQLDDRRPLFAKVGGAFPIACLAAAFVLVMFTLLPTKRGAEG